MISSNVIPPSAIIYLSARGVCIYGSIVTLITLPRQRNLHTLPIFDENDAPIELRPVIFALNDYAERLNQSHHAYSQFVANTAHQLRTSFAIITSQLYFGSRQSNLAPSQQELLSAIQSTVNQSTKVVNQMLTLAAVEQGWQTSPTQTPVNLTDIIKSVIEELAPIAHLKNIDLGTEILESDIQILASAHVMRELVINLTENAIHHNKLFGIATVNLKKTDEYIELIVEDNGPGIPEQEREKVFERFYRLDETKQNSSGLGLSIVAEICKTLRASITLSTPKNHSGLIVSVKIPINPPQTTAL